MNWINNFVRPKIRSLLTQRREMPDGQWITCPESGQMVFYKDLEANQFVVPGSGYHWRMNARQRLAHTFGGTDYRLVPVPAVPPDPLKFRDSRRYVDRLKDARTASEQQDDAVLVAEGALDGMPVVVAAQDFTFMAGSLGMAAGEAVITGMLRAVDLGQPFILFSASGGARMQEGILSLMQMPRTTIAVQRLREAKLPYIVVLTDPTSGGVTASYAMLGDIHIAEPNALVCFAGPRVIQQTIREQLPDGFQRSEYLLAHGMVDMVVHRHKLRETLSRVGRLLMAGVEARRARDRAAVPPTARPATSAKAAAGGAEETPGLSATPAQASAKPAATGARSAAGAKPASAALSSTASGVAAPLANGVNGANGANGVATGHNGTAAVNGAASANGATPMGGLDGSGAVPAGGATHAVGNLPGHHAPSGASPANIPGGPAGTTPPSRGDDTPAGKAAPRR